MVETGQLPRDLGASFHAAQSQRDIAGRPERRVQIVWMNGGMHPDMPLNQQRVEVGAGAVAVEMGSCCCWRLSP